MKQFKRATTATRRLLIFALMSGLLLTTGCKGCFKDPTKAPPEEKKEKAKENFETQTPVTLPGLYPLDPEEKKKLEEEAKDDDKKRALMNRLDPAQRFNRTKLGHWVSIDFLAIANNFNADGYLETTSLFANKPNMIEGTDYYVQSARPVNLVKGDWKKLETSVFIPRREQISTTSSVQYIFNNGSSLPVVNRIQPHTLMEDYQFHVVLLSSRSDSFKFLSFMDWVRLPSDPATRGEEPTFYSVVPTTKGKPIPLPSQSLNWTTIAYLIWDDLDPEDLSQQQKQALVDWLHFGGQIIFSGPDCLDRLQTSFLADYLPGQFEESITLNKSDLEELNKNWSISSDSNEADKLKLSITEKSPLPAIRFKPHVDASFIEGSSGLALERRIGRGRVVATAFSLSNRQIKAWRSLSSFIHNALLRKPNRKFARSASFDAPTFRYTNDRTSIYDPLTGSTLRYVSRDLALNELSAKEVHYEKTVGGYENLNLADQAQYNGIGVAGTRGEYMLNRTGLARNKDDYLHYGGFQSYRQSGVAGWNDNSGIASAARETLKKAARITPPSASFVMKMLGLYLLVLVPINWLLFRVIGKVEWAWIAAPIIALVGAFMVVKYASLDIGFVRSVTHVGVLELQGDFDRGHMTDYSALYTSLSTRYNIELDNLSSQSLPFANVMTEEFKATEEKRKVELNRTTSADLRNFLIRSNSTGLLHTESILDVGGSFRLTGDESLYEVENGTQINVSDAGVLRRDAEGQLLFAWIGELGAGENAKLEFRNIEGPASSGWNKVESLVGNAKVADAIWESQNLESDEAIELESLGGTAELAAGWDELSQILKDKMNAQQANKVSRPMLASAISEIGGANVSLSGVFQSVTSRLEVGPGEVRLIGRSDQKLDNSKINPAATQSSHNMLVLVHLRHANLPVCKADENAISDIVRGRSNLDQEAEENFIDLGQ